MPTMVMPAVVDDTSTPAGQNGTILTKAVWDSVGPAIDTALAQVWTAVTFGAGNFVPSSGTWVVESGDVLRNHYTTMGKLLIWQVWIATTTVTGTPTLLTIAVPTGTFPTTVLFASGEGNNNGAASEDVTVTPDTASTLSLQRQSGATWTAATNTTAVKFTFVGALA